MAQLDERLLDVNQHGVLRIPMGVWLALLFLARHWLITFFVLISSIMNRETMKVLGGDFSWVILAIELPAVFLLWLCTRRRPEAGQFVRAIWPWARHLAAGTALLHLAYVIWFLWSSTYWLPWPELFLASCALIDLVIILSFYRSGHLRQVFLEFPLLSEKSQK